MNEIKKIHLDRQPFTISVEAHRELQAYLDAIERQVGPKGHDVLKEIELRMAELLAERGVTADKVVLPEDVEFLKEQLGKPGDFKDEGSHGSDAPDSDDTDEASADETHDADRTSHTEADDQPKRLYRDTENAMIAGVASGLAAYFRIDPLIVRLLFIVLLFTGGAGIITYILLWILVPEAKTPSERLQMRGKAVTVDNIKRLVDRADLPAAAASVNRTTVRIAGTLGNALRILFGIFVVIMGTALFTATMIAGAYLFVHGARVNDTVVFPIGVQEHVGVISAGIASILLSLGLIKLGNIIVSKKRSMPGWVVALGGGLVITAAAVAIVIGITVAPRVDERRDRTFWNNTDNTLSEPIDGTSHDTLLKNQLERR